MVGDMKLATIHKTHTKMVVAHAQFKFLAIYAEEKGV